MCLGYEVVEPCLKLFIIVSAELFNGDELRVSLKCLQTFLTVVVGLLQIFAEEEVLGQMKQN